ncbi:hypothetical protein WJX81_004248 [Elliptochloris bilobata]|uniref:DUF3054 domain-containing protein n=1 Tax=Elliptochloris bilobata TaxID=381761 RepID=A0AAW1RWW7_9CHLO
MKLERVERLGEEAWAGVAAVDRGEDNANTGLARAVLLAGGDAAALLLFAAVGRSSHSEGLAPVAVLATAAPFLLGWFAAAVPLGGFGRAACGERAGEAALAAAKCWAVGVPAGIAVRSLARGYAPDKAFVIVTLVVTGVLLVGWRAGLAAITAQAAHEDRTPTEQLQRRRDKRGNPLEFFRLLTSLTKRW